MKKLIAMGLTVIMTAVAVCGCGSSDRNPAIQLL